MCYSENIHPKQINIIQNDLIYYTGMSRLLYLFLDIQYHC